MGTRRSGRSFGVVRRRFGFGRGSGLALPLLGLLRWLTQVKNQSQQPAIGQGNQAHALRVLQLFDLVGGEPQVDVGVAVAQQVAPRLIAGAMGKTSRSRKGRSVCQ